MDIQGDKQLNKTYELPTEVDASIFRAYDIRGIVDEQLTESLVYAIGRGLATISMEKGVNTIAIGRDGRLSGPTLSAALRQGILDAGADVIDIGMVPTPVLYFATHRLDTTTGIMLTGSHNPVNYNGLKIVMTGDPFAGDEITGLYDRIKAADFASGEGKCVEQDLLDDYVDYIVDSIKIEKPLKIVIDCGNGAGGIIAEKLYQKLGCEIVPLYCEVDGSFPNHHPDPSVPENIAELIDVVKAEKADAGLAFDGDADRLGFVDNEGNLIWPDRQMILFSEDILKRQPGAQILFDVKCSKHLADRIKAAGGEPIMWKTGHSVLKSKLKETGAPLAGEMSGHIFFKERWFGFDDGLYTGVRLLEILAKDSRTSAEIFAAIPDSINTPELKLPMADALKFDFMKTFIAEAEFGAGGAINTVDGIRVDFADGWGLVRPSNTTPYLVLRFEADTQESLERIQALFKQNLLKLDQSLEIPY